MIRNLLIVALGGGIGTMMRYGINLLIKKDNFPLPTLLINIAGSLAIGMLMALAVKTNNNIHESTKLFLVTGICGGFTTFSAFSYENLELMQAGKYNMAFLYMLLSVLLGLIACWAGFKMINT